jgi:hypothetical protein
MPRQIVCILLLLVGCRAGADRSSLSVVDFIKEFDRAEKRPPAAYALIDYSVGGTRHPSISAPAPGRIIWELPLPRRGVFHAAVTIDGTVPVRFRIGVSDDRIYEDLASTTISSAASWTDLATDLSAYAGWKWSLFYRPERRRWRVVLSTDAVAGIAGRALWGQPLISTDAASAREYAARRAEMR